MFWHFSMTRSVTVPKPSLSLIDAIALIVGVVIGAGILKAPSAVANNTSSPTEFLLVWLLGGGLSLVGALCYAELATTYPHTGGDYYYFMRAFGRPVAFLFAWARLSVIQTGSIALLAFVLGDYLAELLPFGTAAAPVYAALAIVLLTVLNLVGVRQGARVQVILTIAEIVGLLLIVGAGLFLTGTPTETLAPAIASPPQSNVGLAMVFVLFTYGGWNEAAFLAAELRQVDRNMLRALLAGIAILTAIYLLVNLAYLKGLGLSGVAQAEAVGADLMRQAMGETGVKLLSLFVVVSVLGSANATIFTAARTNYALGQDFVLFRSLGQWREQGSTPATALLVQGAIALTLILFGAITREGFETMVAYVTPVFWFFFLLTGIAFFVLRIREPQTFRPFQVPLYPVLPILFCLTCGYMLYSSLVYTKIGALVGVAVLLAGVPLLWFDNRKRH